MTKRHKAKRVPDSERGFVFYVQDYFGALDVRRLPPDIRLVWNEMWFLTFKSPRPGVLLKENGQPWTDKELAGEIRVEEELIRTTRDRVIADKIADVDRTTGQLVCRKMKRDQARRASGRKYGLKGGGNPALKKAPAASTVSESAAPLIPFPDDSCSDPARSVHDLCTIPAAFSTFSNNGNGNKPEGLPATFKGDVYTPDPVPDPDPYLGDISTVQDISPSSGAASAPGDAEEQRRGLSGDQAYGLFTDQHLKVLGQPYLKNEGDFFWLNKKLRKTYGLSSRDTPPQWAEAVANYFATPLGKYTVMDLCSRYAVFCRGPLNEYGKPGGNREQERRDATKRAIASVLGHLDGDLQ